MVAIGIRVTGEPREVPETTVIEPYKVYEIIVRFNRELPEAEVLAAACRRLKEDYPMINIIYAEVSGDTVVFQVYDDPGLPIVLQVIIILIIGIVLLYVSAEVIEKFTRLIEKVTPPQPPEKAKPIIGTIMWLGIGLTVVGLGAYLISTAITRPLRVFKRG